MSDRDITDSPMSDDEIPETPPETPHVEGFGNIQHPTQASTSNPGNIAGRKRRASQVSSSSDETERAANSDNHTSALAERAKKARKGDYQRRSKKKKKKNPSPSDWHMTRKEIPEEAQATKNALELHLRTMWQLPSQGSLPPVALDQSVIKYNERFKAQTDDNIRISVTRQLDQAIRDAQKVEETLAAFKAALHSAPKGLIVTNIGKISESHLNLIFSAISSFDLERWAPDLRTGDADSLYNLLHEHLAITTFQQVSIAFGYTHMANNLSFVRDLGILRKMYRSFVFSYMAGIARAEEKRPGAQANAIVMSSTYRRREKLGEDRTLHLRNQGLPLRVIHLAAETDAHSDDELAPPPPEPAADAAANANIIHVHDDVYYIKTKEGRSEKVTNLFRITDGQRLAAKKRQGGCHYRQERKRRVPPFEVESTLTAMPKFVPIDFFDPDFWNNDMTVKEKVDIIDNGIVVALPRAEHCRTWSQFANWKNLSNQDFMRRYGDDVLKDYVMPTPEEISLVKRESEKRDKGKKRASN